MQVGRQAVGCILAFPVVLKLCFGTGSHCAHTDHTPRRICFGAACLPYAALVRETADIAIRHLFLHDKRGQQMIREKTRRREKERFASGFYTRCRILELLLCCCIVFESN